MHTRRNTGTSDRGVRLPCDGSELVVLPVPRRGAAGWAWLRSVRLVGARSSFAAFLVVGKFAAVGLVLRQ
jgi:hypothetical protein